MPKRQHSKAHGAIFWAGASRIDSQPIMGIVTGIISPSTNPKTGNMHQTWILRSDTHPMDAIKTGADVSVCGDCPLRLNPKTGKKLCYVTQRRPSGVYRSYTNDKLPIVKIDARSNIWFDLKPLRIGSYGDPTAIPIEVWTDWVGLLKSRKIRHTGYTRRWENPENQGFRKILMASVFSDEEQELASSMGWRTYRILPQGVAVPPNQILCPGSKEAGLLKTCRECLMCGGTSRRSDVAVYAHGYNESLFTGVS